MGLSRRYGEVSESDDSSDDDDDGRDNPWTSNKRGWSGFFQ
jgi:hypothetical protein